MSLARRDYIVRRDHFLQRVLHVMCVSAIFAIFVSLLAQSRNTMPLTQRVIIISAQVMLALNLGVCVWCAHRRCFDRARTLFLGTCLVYSFVITLCYMPMPEQPMMEVMYLTLPNLFYMFNIIASIILERWERARGWLAAMLVSYGVAEILLYALYGAQIPQLEVFVTLALSALVLFVAVAVLTRAFTADLNELVLQSEALHVRAVEASRIKSQFLANMSHELRTPLNAIIGYADLIEEEASDLEIDHFNSDLNKLKSAADHLHGLINDVLDLSKIEAGKLELIRAELDLPSFLTELEATISPLCAKNANTLEVLLPAAPLPTLSIDEVRLRQVLLNLLSNAAKFTHKGTITLRLSHDATRARLCFEVQDTGIGIPAEKLEKIFEPFEQVDGSTTRKYGGTGLGLPISVRLTQMMGGELSVESLPGEGSRFEVGFPV